MNVNKMMKQMQAIQENALKAQNELAQAVVEGTAGGGAVKVTMTGAHELKTVEISQDVVDSKDKEMLEDLVKAAFEDALRKTSAAQQDSMRKAMGGLQIPGMPGML